MPTGIPIPNGFAITAEGYRYILTSNEGAWQKLHDILDNLDPSDMKSLAIKAEKARAIVYNAEFPPDLLKEVLEAYHKLQTQYGTNLSVAVRSSGIIIIIQLIIIR